jgi:hypothetical protein
MKSLLWLIAHCLIAAILHSLGFIAMAWIYVGWVTMFYVLSIVYMAALQQHMNDATINKIFEELEKEREAEDE